MNRNQAEPDARKYSTCHAQYVAQSCITQTPGTRVRRTRFVIYVDLGKKNPYQVYFYLYNGLSSKLVPQAKKTTAKRRYDSKSCICRAREMSKIFPN